jgi:predicted site-specific integrase-resolvase
MRRKNQISVTVISDQKYVNRQELSEILGVSVRTICRLDKDGVIKPIWVTPACPRYHLKDTLKVFNPDTTVLTED